MAARQGNLQPSYNIAPTTTIDIIVSGGDGRELRQARWGFVPLWWKKRLKGMPATFNAQSDRSPPVTISQKMPVAYHKAPLRTARRRPI